MVEAECSGLSGPFFADELDAEFSRWIANRRFVAVQHRKVYDQANLPGVAWKTFGAKWQGVRP
eukprot:2271469-Amphidinium_carterae.1